MSLKLEKRRWFSKRPNFQLMVREPERSVRRHLGRSAHQHTHDFTKTETAKALTKP